MNKELFFKLPSGLVFPRIIPGPMEGVMTDSFCTAAHRLELCSGWITPYIRITTNVPRDAKLKAFMSPFNNSGLPVIVQLMGVDADVMAAAAERLVQLGASGINLNFACPSNQVVRSGTGGALLRTTDKIMGITKCLKKAVGTASLSVKLRSGFNEWRECGDLLAALSDSEMLDFVAVHFRTVRELYRKIDNTKERMAFIVENCGDLPLIGSGDIFSVDDADEILKKGCAGVMAARGLLKDPFLIRRIENLIDNNPVLFTKEQGCRIFFNTLLDISQERSRCIKKSKLLEYAGMIWGRSSDTFQNFCQMDDKDLEDFRFPPL
ncbi:tRNA-dihydrouridine synthase family protein [Lentisphaerota bacterium ZTH]|nr:tRNA-dihydrouridine synthase family protein [Lentisphaerota bacterium]WET07645.1 tRNA-dihydrouridine synthase family protein [Lentisphaerota bacterium ZTH]